MSTDLVARTLALGMPALPSIVPASQDYIRTTLPLYTNETTKALSANGCYMYAWLCTYDLTIDQVAVKVSTGVASAKAKVVVYEADMTGRPAGAPLFETGDFDCSTSSTSPTNSQACTFRKGHLYWIGVRSSSTATLVAYSNTSVPISSLGSSLATSANNSLLRTIAYAGAAPAWTYSNSELTAMNPPAVYFRAA